MKYILHTIWIAAVLASCQSVQDQPDISGCYRMVLKQDTATLSLNREGDQVSGSLSYHWYEKDHNDGTFKGTIENDSIIKAHYTFQSEGTTSVRDILFRVRGDQLLQGYGEQMMKNDTSVFRDVDLAIFDTKNPFVKGCQ